MGAVAAGGISGFSAPLQTGLVAPIGTAFSQVPPAIAAQQGPISAAAGTAGTTTSASFGVPLTTGMQTQTQTAMTGAQTTIAGAVPGLTGASTQAGRAVPTGFSAGLPGMDPATRGAFQSVNGIIAASNGILGAAANLSGQQIGRRFGEGISYGMESTRAEISAKAAQLVAAASAATTAAAQIKSPSRLFAAHGRDMGLGAIVGLESTFGDATTAGTELVNAVAPNWDTATASAQQAAETITTTFSGVTLIPESEAERSLSLIQSIQSEIDKITLEDVQGRGNVLTAFFDDAMNATINDGFNAFFQDAANQAAAVLDSRGTSAGGAYVAGTGSLVAGQAPTAEAMVVLLQQIRDGLANPGTTTINQQIAAPVTPMLDVYSPVTANRHADMMADRIRQSLEYSNQGER